MKNLYLSIIIIIIYGIYLQQRRKVEGFAIITAIKTFAKLLNNVRKIMKKMNKGIFKQIIKLNKKTKTFRKKILKNKKKIVKAIRKSKKASDATVKAQVKSEQTKQNGSTGSGFAAVFLPFIGIYSKKLKLIGKVLLTIKNTLINAPEDIGKSLFAMLGNIKDHITVKNAGILLLYPLIAVILLSQLSETIAVLLSIEDNLILTGLLNFIFIFVITFVGIVFVFKYKNDYSMKKVFEKISINEILIKSFWITLQVILLNFQLSGMLFKVVNRFTSNITILHRLLKVKNSTLIGFIHLLISLLHPIYLVN